MPVERRSGEARHVAVTLRILDIYLHAIRLLVAATVRQNLRTEGRKQPACRLEILEGVHFGQRKSETSATSAANSPCPIISEYTSS